MFPLPFSISPLLLSVLVFYPWALALGVWQIGKHSSKSPRTTSSAARSVIDQSPWESDLASSIDPNGDHQNVPCGVVPSPYVPSPIHALRWQAIIPADLRPVRDDPSLPARAPPSIA